MNSLPIKPVDCNYNLVGGIDEVGRGCFAGPVVSALVILPNDFECELINDSKKLSDKKRREVYQLIKDSALHYTVQAVGVKSIDKWGIEDSTFKSMEKCINKIDVVPEYLLIDGNRWTSYKDIPYETVVKGDSTYMCIAAASILAKVERDDYMIKLGEMFPEYGFEKNKGYGSKAHRDALKEYGPTQYHRTQFIRNHI
jgi:ribonuclease HII